MCTATRLLLLLGAAALCAQQRLDEGYTAKIREATTDPMFLTELVDHLPASDRVPTPEKALGYIAGAPEKLTYAKDIARYLREVAKASPRVRVFSMGQTEENREMVLVLVSDEANLAKLDRYKEITNRLADPRKVTDAEAGKLLSEGLPFYWATGGMHSGETGAPEMLMELVYRLAVEETPFIQNIRRNAIVMITPVLEVDGRERQVDLYRWRKANPNKPAPSLIYWGKYVAHDNNRDGMALSLALSRHINKTFLEYKPQVFHDLHESVPFLYTSTGMGPYNAWLDPIVINEWQKLAWHEVEQMTQRGVPGVWTHGFYDGWAGNYGMITAQGRNSIGRFYETFGNGGADTRDRTVQPTQTSRAWYRPNPPLPRVRWSHRNNVNMQQSALLFAINYAATNRQEFLKNFWLKSKRSVAKAASEGPAAYVISAVERPNEAASMIAHFRLHGIEVHRLKQEIEIGSDKFAVGSYVVRMDQPYSRMGDMMLDRQYYNAADPSPYDDTGWTVGPLRNVKTWRVTDAKILAAAMDPLKEDPAPQGRIEGQGSAVYAINQNADRVLATLRFRLADVKMHAAEDGFEAAGRKFNAGSILIKAADNPGDLKGKLETAARELGVTVQALGEAPKVASHPLAAPRVALVHSWISTQTEGWFRLAFEASKVPFTYVSDTTLRETADLRSRFDVIVYGPTPGDSRRVVNGLPVRGEAIAFKASDLTPNFGTAPDQTDDMRGGIGLQGLLNVQKFVEQGGLFVLTGSNALIPVDYGMIDGVQASTAQQLRVRGSVLQATVSDAKSPVMYGYDANVGVYFNTNPLLTVSLTGGMGGFGGGGGAGGQAAQGRVSGRGGPNDPDIPQGRPYRPGQAGPPADPSQPPAEVLEQMRNFLPSPAERPRVLLRFGDASNLLISGMLAGGSELSGKAAVVDVPKGKGHYLLFAINPMWRHETHGSWAMMFNAIMNYDNLNAGRPAAPPRAEGAKTSPGDDDLQ